MKKCVALMLALLLAVLAAGCSNNTPPQSGSGPLSPEDGTSAVSSLPASTPQSEVPNISPVHDDAYYRRIPWMLQYWPDFDDAEDLTGNPDMMSYPLSMFATFNEVPQTMPQFDFSKYVDPESGEDAVAAIPQDILVEYFDLYLGVTFNPVTDFRADSATEADPYHTDYNELEGVFYLRMGDFTMTEPPENLDVEIEVLAGNVLEVAGVQTFEDSTIQVTVVQIREYEDGSYTILSCEHRNPRGAGDIAGNSEAEA